MQECFTEMARGQELLRQSAMLQYRLYLLDEGSHIKAAEGFFASKHADATEVAISVQEACSDICDGYELWCGAKRILSNREERSRMEHEHENAIQEHQNMVLDLEERLQT